MYLIVVLRVSAKNVENDLTPNVTPEDESQNASRQNISLITMSRKHTLLLS